MAWTASGGARVGVSLAAAVLLTVAAWPAAPTLAHSGSGEQPYRFDEGGGVRLEGESYTSAPDTCDPTLDGEHTRPTSSGGASRGEAAFIPDGGCTVTWDSITFFEERYIPRIRGSITGADSKSALQTYRIELEVGDTEVLSTTRDVRQDDGWVNWTPSPVPTVAKGTYDVTLTFDVVDGEGYENLVLDYVDFTEKCANDAPVYTAITGDGMLDGFTGWTNHTYTHEVEGLWDPDGDPYEATWTLPNGSSHAGESVTHTLHPSGATRSGAAEDRDVTLHLADDPSSRCGRRYHEPAVSEEIVTVSAVPDLAPTFADLGPGRSCSSGAVVPSWESEDVLADHCQLQAGHGVDGLPDAVVNASEIRLDGDGYAADQGLVTASYDSDDVADGDHTLRVCANATDDKYDRSFCGPSYAFEDRPCANAPPTVEGIESNGMLEGRTGWVHFPYDFALTGVTDPEGDPVSIEWDWSDGFLVQGAEVTRSFDDEGATGVVASAADDPSVRCPSSPSREGLRETTFHAVEKLQVLLVTPRDGLSCAEGVFFRSRTGLDTVAGSCPVTARARASTPRLDPALNGSLLLDGDVFYYRSGARELQGVYHSTRHSTSLHTMEACFHAVGDVHDRVFCDSYDFLNVGR